jgi:hypothetical protein
MADEKKAAKQAQPGVLSEDPELRRGAVKWECHDQSQVDLSDVCNPCFVLQLCHV